ncbi:hypothetical protein Pmani_007991 [Petrolisthes manimaculis]|uniref:Uncharacterized protein n=1 Tax=Petrolisthes manimaculis TaxID=1843537 RepID=A0AAE1UI55_9EUCA|nr:hypothetical protein Pmani_007991 [Petrolisthes manimaculis]
MTTNTATTYLKGHDSLTGFLGKYCQVTKQNKHKIQKDLFIGFYYVFCYSSNLPVASQRNTISRPTLKDDYKTFCETRGHQVASIVNVGRFLSGLGVKAKTRIGGRLGHGQSYAYVGLKQIAPPSVSQPPRVIPVSQPRPTPQPIPVIPILQLSPSPSVPQPNPTPSVSQPIPTPSVSQPIPATHVTQHCLATTES